MSVGFENKEFTLEANVSERDKVSGRGNFKENVVCIVKSGGARPMYTSCVAILLVRVGGT